MSQRLVPVLLYHSVVDQTVASMRPYDVHPLTFDAQMQYLDDAGYEPIALSRYAAWLREPQSEDLPAKPVVLTFDDGFADFTRAASTLHRHGFPSTLFVSTSYVGGHSSWLEGEPASRPMLSWSQLKDVSAGGVEVGAHSHVHRPLDEIAPRAARREVEHSKEIIEQILGTTVRGFAYPHGYHGARVVEAVRDASYSYACAVRDCMSGTGDDVFAISRLFVGWSVDADAFARLLEGSRQRHHHSERLRTKGWRTARRVRTSLHSTR